MKLKPLQALKTFFGYDAVKARDVRRQPLNSIQSEDDELDRYKRRKLVATERDQVRNISLVAWMFRKHLDYVSEFTFHATSGSDDLNVILERLWKDYNRKTNCDIAGRHTLKRMIRLFEASKIIDGDAGLLLLNNGKLQGVEGSRIAKPDSSPRGVNLTNISEHGLVLDKNGLVKKYCITRVVNGRREFERLISAKNILFDGYFTRFEQTRGISPLSAAVNMFLDLYKSWEYQLIKAKLHAMFGIVIKSGSVDANGSGWQITDKATGLSPTSATTNNGYNSEIKEGGMLFELEPGDDIETIESRTPSNEFQDYTDLMVRIGMLSLDIPFSFYNSGKSSYSAMKQDRVEYENSAKIKQAGNRDILMKLAEWKHLQWFNEGLLKGFQLEDIIYDFRSIGRPWMEELAEVDAAIRRIDAGLSSRQREAKQRGEDWFEIMDELKHEKELIDKSGINIVSGMPGQTTIAEREAVVEEKESNDE